jgi:hypothetical protein
MVLVGVWPALPIRAADEVVSDCGDNGGPNQLRAKLAAMQSSGGGTLSFACGPATIVINATDGALPTMIRRSRFNGNQTTSSTDGWGDPALGRRPGDDYRQPL